MTVETRALSSTTTARGGHWGSTMELLLVNGSARPTRAAIKPMRWNAGQARRTSLEATK